MCFGGGGSTPTNTTTRTELPEWVEGASEELYGTAQPVAERPYPFYDDPRIAGFNPDQLASFDLARSNVGSWEPSFFNSFFGYGAAGDIPRRVKQLQYLLVGHWYNNRDAMIAGTITKEIELGVQSLSWRGRTFYGSP